MLVDSRRLRPVLLCLQDRRLPPSRQIFEAARFEQHLVKLSTLKIAELGHGRVADDLLDAAAQLSARHCREYPCRRSGITQPWYGARGRGRQSLC
jgi:hypothetical protein